MSECKATPKELRVYLKGNSVNAKLDESVCKDSVFGRQELKLRNCAEVERCIYHVSE